MPRERSFDVLLELFDRPSATRAEVLEKTLACALQVAEADAAVALLANNRALERWTMHGDSVTPETERVGRPNSEFGRMLMRAIRPLQIADVAQDGRASQEDICTAIDAGPGLYVPLRRKQQAGGYLSVFRIRGAPSFTAEQIRLITFLASWLMLALENLRLAESVERLAVTDDLTQVYNYRFLKSALKREIKRAGRFSQQMSIVMIDVDNLKGYNDRNGHMRGSLLLREMAGLFVQQIRSWDLCAKYGGDEFTLILPQTARDGAMVVAERMREAVAEHTFPLATQGAITISLGVATFPEDGTDPMTLIRASDTALYAAKRNGRNRVEAVVPKAA